MRPKAFLLLLHQRELTAAENTQGLLARSQRGGAALQLGFELVTHNVRDFERIPDLVVKQP
jgi:predicted nucleic acid-binding protein